MKILKTLAFLSLTLILHSGITATFAQSTWSGNTNSDWFTASNWVGGVLPPETDDIIIPGTRSNFPDLTANRKMKSLTIESGGSITFSVGTATIDDGAVNNSGNLIVNGGTLDINDGTGGTLSNSGTITLSSGQLKVASTATNLSGANYNQSGGIFESSNLTVNASSSVTFSTGTMEFKSNITNSGTVTSSSGTLILDGLIANQTGAVFTMNGGDVEVKQEPSTNAATINVISGNLFFNGKDLQNLSGGTLTQTGGTLRLDRLTNDGQVTASDGTFTIDGFFTNNSGKNITVDGGSLIVKNNTSTNAGSVSVSSGLLDFGTADKDLTIQAGGSVSQTGGTVTIKKLTVDATGSYTFSGTTLDITGDLENSGTVTLNPGTVNVAGHIITEIGSDLTIAGAIVTSHSDATFRGSVTISDGSLDMSTNEKITFVDGGTFNQTGGTVIAENLELKNGASYNQSGGEVQIDHDLKVPIGTTFASTGGTVHFTGAAGGGADYRGNVQFHNVLIDDGADPKFNNDGDDVTINISGNFTNNNADMEKVDKTTFVFNGTGDQTIYSAIVPIAPYDETTFGTLIVDKPSGALTLLSDLAVDDAFTPTQGYLDLDGNTLYVNGEVYDGPLPVELISFSAVLLESKVQLEWRTETEVSNYGFDVERVLSSSQNLIWDKIGFVEGHGNSNSPKDYSFVDNNVTAGRYSYRLKQVDTDGKFEYSKTIEIDISKPMEYDLSQNYPNPFNPSTTIRFSVLESSNVNLSIFNSLGEKIEELVNEVKEPGVHTIEFNADNLSSGTYIYRIRTSDFVQTKKMILLK